MLNRNTIMGIALLLPLGVTGCATKGYVREQVNAAEQNLAQEMDRTRSNVSELESRTSGIQGDLDGMHSEIDGARALALGDVDLTEVERHRVYFAFDSAEIAEDQRAALDRAVATLESSPRFVVNVYGFADPTGRASYNVELGRRRAEAVVRYLVDRTGDPLLRYEVLSFGEGAPRSEEDALGSENAERRQALVVVLEPIEAGGDDVSQRQATR